MESVIGGITLALLGVFVLVVLVGLLRRALEKTVETDAVVAEKHETVFRMAAVSADGRKHLYVVTFHTGDGDRQLTVSKPVFELVSAGDACRIMYKGSVLKGIQGEFASTDRRTGEEPVDKDTGCLQEQESGGEKRENG